MIMKTKMKMNDAFKNSAQHARSAASRLDDVIDRSALEQAREGLGGRDMEEAAHLELGVQQKEHFRGERTGALHAIECRISESGQSNIKSLFGLL
jgi:hypothetical protein